jgi:hypothetical protein
VTSASSQLMGEIMATVCFPGQMWQHLAQNPAAGQNASTMAIVMYGASSERLEIGRFGPTLPRLFHCDNSQWFSGILYPVCIVVHRRKDNRLLLLDPEKQQAVTRCSWLISPSRRRWKHSPGSRPLRSWIHDSILFLPALLDRLAMDVKPRDNFSSSRTCD